MGRGIKGILVGGAIGAVLGILYAPRAGKITREMLAEKTDKFLNEESLNEGTFLGDIAKTTKSAVEASHNVINEVTGNKFQEDYESDYEFIIDEDEAVDNEINNVKNSENVSFEEKNDELRRKIDNARSKIASQVKKNIDEHKMENSNNSVDVEPKSVKTYPSDEEL